MTKPVKRLSSLEIDEVSLVDRPANQHGLVTITKRDEGAGMAVYDEHGNEIDESQLESGDIVFSEDGEPIQLFSDEDLQALLESGQITEDDLADDRELVGVGKADAAAVTGGARTIFQAGRKTATRELGDLKRGYKAGTQVNGHIEGGRSLRFGNHLGRNRGKYGVAAAAGTEENVRGRFRKSEPSLGEQVLSDLSKALTDSDRDQVISKAMDRISKAEREAQAAVAKAQQLEDAAEFASYVEIAKSFELPVETDELAGILQSVSQVLDEDQLDTLERILNTAAAAIDFEERGSAGSSPLMAYVGEGARELVGKSAGELTEEQATTALFAANDDAYLAYLSENQR